MALGYTPQFPLQYHPFQRTSFGYGLGELQNLPNNPFPNATDYAKVIIQVGSNWDETGHILTTENDTAISTYSSETNTWTAEGQRDGVDEILANLVFFPPAYQPLTDWRPTEFKENVIDGNFADEQPGDTDAVPDTLMIITVYNSSGYVVAYDIFVEPIQPVYDNTRPYFSTELQAIDIAHADYDTLDGKEFPLPLISENVDSEEILELKAEFIRTTDGTQYTGTAFGEFVNYDKIYIGGKKARQPNTTDKRFHFTGKRDECNAYIQTLEFSARPSLSNLPAAHSFFLRTSISDGQIGSYVDTLVWHSDTYPRDALPSLPNLSFTEDIPAYWDFGAITFYNLDEMGEVDTYSVKVKLQFGGLSTSGAEQFYTTTTVDNESRVDAPDGQGNYETIYTITDSDLNTILTALRNLVFVPKRDYNANFTIGYAWEFSSTEYQTIYISPSYRTTIVNGTARPELSNTYSIHSFVEDFRYDLANGNVPQIVHPHNDDFQIDFIASTSGIGEIKTFDSTVTFTQVAAGHTRFSGTRNEVNAALNAAYFAPNPDVNGTVFFDITLDRLSGNLEFEQRTTGRLELVAGNRPELTLSNPGPLDWEEDVSLTFDSGIQIADDATTELYLPAYGTEYSAIVRLRDPEGNQFTDGVVTSPNKGLLTSHNNYGDIFTMTGSRSAINACLQNIKFIPDVDYESRLGYVDDTYVDINYVEYKNFYLDFYIERDYDSVVLMNYTYKIFFNPPTIHEETSYTPTIIADNVSHVNLLQEDTALSFNTGLQILDKATENTDYSMYDTTYTLETRVLAETLYVEDDYVFLGETVSEDIFDTISNFTFSTFFMYLDIPDDIWQEYQQDTSNNTFVIEWYHNYFKTGAPTTWTDDWQNNEFFKLDLGIGSTPSYYDPVVIDSTNQRFIIWFSTTTSGFINTIIRDVFQTANQEAAEDLNMFDDLFRITLNTSSSSEVVDIPITIITTVYTNVPYVDPLDDIEGYVYTDKYSYVEKVLPATDFILENSRTDLLDSYSGTGTVADPFIMSATKSNMNTALTNMIFSISEVDREPTNAWWRLEYKLYRTYDNKTYYDYDIKTLIGALQPHDEITYTQPAAIDWYKNQIAVFDSGIVIDDLATENQYYQNYYNTTYTVEVRSNVDIPYMDNGYVDDDYVEPQAREQNFKISTTRTDLLDSLSGTGRGEDYFVMTGSRSAINTCLQNIKMLPDINWTTDQSFTLSYKIKRDADNIVYYNHNISTTFNATTIQDDFEILMDATENIKFVTTNGGFYNLRKPSSDNVMIINDRITENPEYQDYYNTKYKLKLRIKYYDQNTGNYEYYRDQEPYYLEKSWAKLSNYGNGTLEDPFEFDGTRSQVNNMLNQDPGGNQLKMAVSLRLQGHARDEATNSDYYFEYVPDDIEMEIYVERLYDSVVLSNWETITLLPLNS